jgi:hypothetical protein
MFAQGLLCLLGQSWQFFREQSFKIAGHSWQGGFHELPRGLDLRGSLCRKFGILLLFFFCRDFLFDALICCDLLEGFQVCSCRQLGRKQVHFILRVFACVSQLYIKGIDFFCQLHPCFAYDDAV